jgi:flagellar hook-basal body complex protein FliE
MTIPFNAVATAYDKAAKLAGQSVPPLQETAPPPTQAPDFGKLLTDNLQSVIDSGRDSEQKSLNLINGTGNVVDVVTAISQTELAVESVVTVRDRVISAYEEIMRMPI